MGLNLRTILSLLIIYFALSCATENKNETKITIFCAASLTPVIEQIKDHWELDHPEKIIINGASSGILARQIEHGARADIFLSANKDWMNYLSEAMRLTNNPKTIALNQMVVISPAASGIDSMDFQSYLKQAVNIENKIAIGDPGHVPLGKYTREVLEYYDVYDDLLSKFILTMDARSALRLVELGEAESGIVYFSDAVTSQKTRIVSIVPEESHPKIEYQAVIINNTTPSVREFFEFLHSAQNRHIWKSKGFTF